MEWFWPLGITALAGACALAVLFIWGGLLVDTACTRPYPIPPQHGALIITGASSGIGYDASVTLAKRGFTVFATVRKQADFDLLKGQGLSTLHPVYMDVADEGQIDEAWGQIQEELTKANIPLIGLINNAGINQPYPLEFHPPQGLKRLFQVNALGPIYLTQRVLPHLRRNHGRIIFVTSFASIIGSPLLGAYAGTKRAVVGFADALRLELRRMDVSVSTICPAYVQSSILGKVIEDLDHHISEEARQVYSHHFRPEVRENDEKNVQCASPPSVTTQAMWHALTSPWPKTRYLVANMGDQPGWLPALLAEHLPTRVFDAMVLQKT